MLKMKSNLVFAFLLSAFIKMCSNVRNGKNIEWIEHNYFNLDDSIFYDFFNSSIVFSLFLPTSTQPHSISQNITQMAKILYMFSCSLSLLDLSKYRIMSQFANNFCVTFLSPVFFFIFCMLFVCGFIWMKNQKFPMAMALIVIHLWNNSIHS